MHHWSDKKTPYCACPQLFINVAWLIDIISNLN